MENFKYVGLVVKEAFSRQHSVVSLNSINVMFFFLLVCCKLIAEC